MNIVALGDGACNVADAFSKYSQYKIYKINVDISGDRCYNISKCETAEEYEAVALPKIKTFFKGMKGETLFIVGGSGKISCACLKIMQYIKKLPISILYLKPDLEMLNEVQKMQERLVFGVLQEYTRSGVFEKMYVASTPDIEVAVGGAPILGYYDKINEALVSTLHMINVFENTKSVMGSVERSKETYRIISVGIFDIKNNSEKMFFSLDNARDKCYIYSINENRLKTDEELYTRLKNQIKTKEQENLNISFAIYANDYEYDLGYVIERTPHIQTNTKPAE